MRTRLYGTGVSCFTALSLLATSQVMAAAEGLHSTSVIRVLAVGDTGAADGSEGVAKALLSRAQADPVDALVFLGDNFYMRGLNRRDWVTLLGDVMRPFRPVIATVGPEHVHAVAGNHDYYAYAFLGIERFPMGFFSLGNTREALQKDLWRYHYWWTDDTIVRSHDASVGLQIVFVDSARAVAMDPRYTPDVFDRLRDALALHRGDPQVQWRIVVAHHPLETVGEHGNYGQRPGFLRWGRSRLIGGQDTSSASYREYRRRVLDAIKASGAKVNAFLAGHDHSLQLLNRVENDCPGCPDVHVVAGAGSKQPSSVRPTSGTDYTPNSSGAPAPSPKGFVELEANPLSLKLRFFGEGEAPKLVRMGPSGSVCEFTLGVATATVTTSGCVE